VGLANSLPTSGSEPGVYLRTVPAGRRRPRTAGQLWHSGSSTKVARPGRKGQETLLQQRRLNIQSLVAMTEIMD